MPNRPARRPSIGWPMMAPPLPTRESSDMIVARLSDGIRLCRAFRRNGPAYPRLPIISIMPQTAIIEAPGSPTASRTDGRPAIPVRAMPAPATTIAIAVINPMGLPESPYDLSRRTASSCASDPFSRGEGFAVGFPPVLRHRNNCQCLYQKEEGRPEKIGKYLEAQG